MVDYRQVVLDGRQTAQARTAEVDERVLAAVAGDEITQSNVALVAVGSYGRGELVTHSDVDVLLLHAVREKSAVEALTRQFVYPLWDLGFEVGYAVRTVEECLRTAKEDVVIATTLLDARLLAGDRALFDRFTDAMSTWRRKRASALEAELCRSLAARHARFGDARFDLEGHLKEGLGGLRDLQTLRWLEPTADADLTGPLGVLLAVRDALHVEAGRREDRLAMPLWEPVAQRTGLLAGVVTDGDTDGDTDGVDDATWIAATDELLRQVMLACRNVGSRLQWRAAPVLRPRRRRDPGPPDGFRLVDGRASRSSPSPPAADPAAGLRLAFTVDATAPAPDVVTWAAAAADQGFTPTEETRALLLELLVTGPTAGWEMLDVTGLWTWYLPEMSSARARAQHNPLHALAVDAHLWRTVVEARRLRDDADSPTARAVWDELERPDVLMLAALLHDAGKGMPGDHSRNGVILARQLCRRLNLGADVEETLAFLIGDHLLLSEFAQTRDLDDEELVLSLAARIGTPERLRLLYLLSVADARATGSAAWSPWKGQLLADLARRVAALVADSDLVTRDAGNRIARTRAEALRLRPDSAARLDTLPRRMLLQRTAAAIAADLDLVDGLDERTPVRLRIDGGHCTVVSRDQPGLLALMAGVFCVHGIDIRTADVQTTADGVAVNVLNVASAHGDRIPDERWQRVGTDLSAALAGSDLGAQVDARVVRYETPTVLTHEVRIDNASSQWHSIVDVRCDDRIGLLWDVTSSLAELGLDVQFAKVSTQADTAYDSFSVRDASGARIVDPDAVAARLRELLDERVRNRVARMSEDGAA